MSFLSRVLDRARGEVPLVRPRRSTAVEPPPGPGEAPGLIEQRARAVAPMPEQREMEGRQFEQAQSPRSAEPAIAPPWPPPADEEEREAGRLHQPSAAEVPVHSERMLPPQPASKPVMRELAEAPPALSVRSVSATAARDKDGKIDSQVRAPRSGVPAAGRGPLESTAAPPPPVRPAAARSDQRRDATRKASSKTATDRDSTDMVIRIHIGRIEVRAERERAPAPPSRPAPVAPRLTLDEYSRQRSNGER